MALFAPTLLELSVIEQIETAFHDQRQELFEELWARLEAIHGGIVLNIVSPEGVVIKNPFRTKA
jgi:hypothetical protein